MSADIWLLPNLGAEEGEGHGELPAVAAMAALWSLLFPAGSRLLEWNGAPRSVAWPLALGPPARTPAFDWLGESHEAGGVIAWLNTEDAARAAQGAETELRGPAPEVVRRVHDKAFALRTSEGAGLVPPALRGLCLALDPGELASVDDAVRRIQAHVDRLPPWVAGAFTLKPRLGSSGRGRVPGRDGRADTPELRRALPRLAERGGAIVEPWLRRVRDVSVQLHVGRDGALSLIATLEQCLSASGLYRGHRGEVDYRARVVSATEHDDALLEAAVAVAAAAHAQGFHGPCGIDAFSFEGPEGIALRPVVEFNARFTAGTVLAGLLRRAAPRIETTLGLGPGVRHPFHFAFDARDHPASDPGPDLLVLPLADPGAALRPTLYVARDADSLEGWTAATP